MIRGIFSECFDSVEVGFAYDKSKEEDRTLSGT